MPDESAEITKLLQQWRSGNPDAENALFERIYGDLRRLAHYFMQNERGRNSFEATELVDQIYFRLVAAKDRDWQSRQHFFAIAARSMRRYLIDRARGRTSAEVVGLGKLEGILPASSAKLDFAVTVDRLLNELANYKPEWCTLVELKYFVGLTDEEAAEVMGVKLRTMQRMWCDARQWLFERAGENRAGASAG
jgi:RNA polymerase sigma factor (TIGR02999 family)